MKNSNTDKQTRQTAVTSLFPRAHALTLCALTLVCSTALAPVLPVEAQTCMTESLLYTYDDEPTPRAAARQTVLNKTAAKTAAAKTIAAKNVATRNAPTEIATTAPVVIAEGSMTTMRNHP